ncbi:MAG: CDC48 family AAA ATPase [Dehalococcoidales bacterium]|nr:CDC48 family AAA ATPase [Dehalococcoidales bacterium]
MKDNQSVLLRVAEAKTRDVGRGIVRIDPMDLERIKAEIGDIVEIEGKRKTVAKVMPAYPEDRGKSLMQIDGIVRGNAQVSLDEKVYIRRTTCLPAEKITLSHLTLVKSIRGEGDARYIGTLLDGLPLMEGDTIRANLFGTRSQDFLVTGTVPKGAVIVRSNTRIEIKEKSEARSRGAKIAYEDIGGLQKELQRVREMIELPLKYPQVFERLGIDPPKGVLLHGPPGCGKTLIARAVAHETDAYFTSITGPEIMGKFYGESEGRLRGVFEEARSHAPAILFIDEIDAIAPKREEMGGEKQVERRVVAQLLALMDGLESRGEVIVIGATNIPNSIDPALRRPGRFDREIAISIPDQRGRVQILDIHTRGMPLAEGVNLDKLAQVTHGFVGADLESLCREAAMNSLRRMMPDIDYQMDELPYESLLKLEVTMNDFTEALKEVEPSAIREVFVEVPDVKWEDVGGLEEIKQKLVESVLWPLKYAGLFQQANTKPAKGILLSGPPGTGKTLIAKALANESEVNFISVKGPEMMSKYIGESERGVREVFRKARQASPCIIFFDEFDSLVPERGLSSDSQVAERVISQFLTELDGLEELKGVLVLASTNRKDLIDSAVLRPGRFDFILDLPLPDEKARREIFRVHIRSKPVTEEINVEYLAGRTEGFSGADIFAVCHEASIASIGEMINLGDENGKLLISKTHFENAIESVKTRKGEPD